MKHNYFIRGRTYILLYFLLYISLSFAQKKDSVDYFPLNVGDRYDYYKIAYPDVWFIDSKDSIKLSNYAFSSIIIDTTKLNGIKYYIMSNFFWYEEADTIRTDSNGNVYLIFQGKETILYKFDAKINEIWRATFGDHEFGFKLISRSDTLRLPYGDQYNCLKIGAPGTYPILFINDIGRILFCDDRGNFVLGKAHIRGRDFPFLNSIRRNDVIELNKVIDILNPYPNPFNSGTNINFILKKNSSVKIVLYDIQGREIITLADNYYPAGKYNIPWNGKNKKNISMPSGLYYYKLITAGISISKKLLILK